MLSFIAILALLCIACWRDVQFRRIPNTLVVVGLALGIIFQAVSPSGGGLFSPSQPGGLGTMAAFLGAALGLALLLPLYALRAMGAGDVKLLAMVGAWLGASSVAWAALYTLLAGGVLSIVAMVATRSTGQVLSNLRTMLAPALIQPFGRVGDVPPSRRTTGQLPYAFAVATGTTIEIARHWL